MPDVGLHVQKRGLGTWRHVDSRASTVVQVRRGVSTTEEREGLWT